MARIRIAKILVAATALGTALLTALFLSGQPKVPQAVRIVHARRYQPVEGLEVVTAELRAGRVPRGQLVVLYAQLGPIRPRLLLNPRLEALSALDMDAIALSNAGYFTPEHRPTGLLASGGRILHPFVREAGGAGSGVLVVEQGQVELLERDQVGKRSFRNADLAIQAGPRVIERDGSPGIRGDDGMRANRTAVGRDRRGRFALAIVYSANGSRSGLTLFELQRLLGPKGLGTLGDELTFTIALNLDGGPSTGLHVRHAAPRIDLPPASRVVSVLALHTSKVRR